MTLLAIDPGPEQSAWLVFADGQPRSFGIWPNDELLCFRLGPPSWDLVVIEQVTSYGMPVGREVFETVRWSGRFEQAASPIRVEYLPRLAVKLALCHSPKANDATIRQALLDRFGGSKAVGTKKAPGPLHGIHRDVWSALALAVAWQEREAERVA